VLDFLAVPKNGEVNTQFALYRSLCCDRELIIREGETFPDCPRHTKLSTVWKLVKAEVVQMKTIPKKGGPPPAA
jgi:hypothetical protein